MIAAAASLFNPFPGLRSFEAEEDHLFFGRERQVDELLARLRRSRFLNVVGTSGSGKSSLVRSGLIPALYGGFMLQAGSSWRIAVLRPGDDPIGNLAAALDQPGALGAGAAGAEYQRALLDATLHRSAQGLAECMRLARVPAQDNLLIVVDQFEEIFRFKRNFHIKGSGEEAAAFVRLLLTAAQQDVQPVYVVLTMRSDFIGSCSEFPSLAEAINISQYLVPRLNREERRAAIAGPVAVGGGEIAPRLVLRLLNDVGDDPDQLPILQHALMRTWDHWTEHHAPGEPLDLRHYEAIGTMKEALSQHAEEAYHELASVREQRIAEAMFKALTDRGSDQRGLRRPVRLAEVCSLAETGEQEVIAVVERFRMPGRSFLMPPAGVELTGGSVLDISHESLMRIWTRLIQWVDDEARSAQIYLRLSKAAQQYQDGAGGLWRDPELQLASSWREEASPNLQWARRYDPAFERAMLFLDYSRKERDLWIERREQARSRQLARTRWLAIVLGAGALLTLAFGLYALVLKIDAEDARREAVVQEVIAQRRELDARREKDHAEKQRQLAERERSNAEAARHAAQRQEEVAESERLHAQREQERALGEKRLAEASEGRARSAQSASEAQHRIAVEEKRRAEDLGQQAASSEQVARRLAHLELARSLALQSLQIQDAPLAGLLAAQAFALNGQIGGAEEPNIYDALLQALHRLDPQQEQVLHAPGDAVRALALAGDGRTLATGSDDGGVRLFDLEHRRAAPVLLGTLPGGVRSLVISPGAPAGAAILLAAGGFEGAVEIWDLRQRKAPPKLLAGGGASGGGRSVNGLAFSPAGDRLAAACADGNVRLWDPLRAGTAPAVLPAGARRLTALAISPDGARLAAASAGAGGASGSSGGVLLWSLPRPGERAGEAAVLGAGDDVRSLAMSGDGRLLAAGTGSGAILLWDVGAGEHGRPPAGSPRVLSGHTAAVTALAFSSSHPLLASASLDGTVRLRHAEQPDRTLVLTDHEGWVWAVALSADGERVLSGGHDRTVRVRGTSPGPYFEEVCRRLERNLTRREWALYLPPDILYQPTCRNLPAEQRVSAGGPRSEGAPVR
ncbi:MAG TPA: AAA family ATPase [Thermoanaerobaculia bacterium]